MLQPFPGTVDFAKWEQTAEPQLRGRRAAHALLADPDEQAAEAVHAASLDGRRRDPRRARRRPGTRSTACRQSGSGRRASSPSRAAWPSCSISKLYRQMYANTGIATDSARARAIGHDGALPREDGAVVLCREADARPAAAGVPPRAGTHHAHGLSVESEEPARFAASFLCRPWSFGLGPWAGLGPWCLVRAWRLGFISPMASRPRSSTRLGLGGRLDRSHTTPRAGRR